MTARNLGSLEEVDLREIWPNEANDFTPWLAEGKNMGLLGDALGLRLIPAKAEFPIGDFWLDILAETDRRKKVAIENQIGSTDHRHLGQSLTYAAGSGAEYVVWVAGRFRPEHRAAIDWLNSLNPDKVRFYGVEVKAVKIGDSLPAPGFHVVAAPKEWSRTIPDPSGYNRFYRPVVEQLGKLGIEEDTEAWQEGYIRWFQSGLENAWYGASFVGDSAYLWFRFEDSGDRNKSDRIFGALHESREDIEASLTGKWFWDQKPREFWCEVGISTPAKIKDPPEQIEETRSWILKNLPKLKEILNPRLQKIMDEMDA